jgi:RNA polymerase sigma factor (sigma-70 family)
VPARRSHLTLLPPVEKPAVEKPAVPSSGPATPEEEDGALLTGLERRDSTASARFYDRVRPIIDRTLVRLLGAADPDYEDVVQVALYQMVAGVSRFRRECPLEAWASVVTARAAYRAIRRRRLERRFFASDAADAVLANASIAPVAFASRQAVERVREHLARLDVKRAWTFLLHDVYGYGIEQIGEITDASPSATQSRLVRGRREIHERLRKDVELARFLDDLSEEVP